MTDTKIQWTTKTWNPVVGCEIESPGCKNCYAMKMAGRMEAMNAATGNTPQYLGTTKQVTTGAGKTKTVWTGKIGIAPDRVWEQPLRRKKPTTYFVNSMGDLFHPNVPDAAIDRAFAVMALSPQHTFQILTKHPLRMRAWFSTFDRDINFESSSWPEIQRIERRVENDDDVHASQKHHDETARLEAALYSDVWPLANVHLGVSVEDQRRADLRIPVLLDTPAAVRFISAEPLLGPVDLEQVEINGNFYLLDFLRGEKLDIMADCVEPTKTAKLDWVIVGGESGPDARPMHPDWARRIRDACEGAEVPFFFKQWGAFQPFDPGDQMGNAPWRADKRPLETDHRLCGDLVCGTKDGGFVLVKPAEMMAGLLGEVQFMRSVDTKAAGRRLDGREHNALPHPLTSGETS
ncbi:phage Gp37/Gp68 family protein [Litorimonas sp. WD9-15]|uniref:phage Gp37/Gp68 family protein n=1 Tax=Litorimonas sp. WD9-15 TaxID=3418716 RepID=UPI003D093CF8